MRKRIFEIIEVAEENDLTSRICDIFMMIVIICSLLPIACKSDEGIFKTIEIVTATIFIIDYILRLMTADLKLGKGWKSFFLYPFTLMAIIDLLSILPSIIVFNEAFKTFRLLRLLQSLRVLRIFKFLRYYKSVSLIINVFKKQKESLIVVGGMAIGYILVSALIVISIEPETFPTFFDALYWATISLTTVGYGDIYAVSTTGKIITMLSSFCGIAIVALPAGIVTAGYMDELRLAQEQHENRSTPKGNESPSSKDDNASLPPQ